VGLIFEWNAGKAAANRRKHGVTFNDAATVFADTLSVTVVDHAHSEDERRFVTLGRSATGKLLVVVHVDREERIRLISARAAKPREIRQYEQTGEV
jgi:uncharacterized DUF497 family protein